MGSKEQVLTHMRNVIAYGGHDISKEMIAIRGTTNLEVIRMQLFKCLQDGAIP